MAEGQTNAEFAEEVGVAEATLGNYLRGEREPSYDFLRRLRERRGVDINWLITGEEPVRSVSSPRYGALVSSYDPDSDENDEGYSHGTWKPRIVGARPEIDVRLGAGEGSVGQMLSIGSNGGMTGHRVVAEWVLPEAFMVGVMEANAARTIVMEVVGDSMQPTYQPGDRVMVDLAQTRMVADTVYAISDGFSEPQIKRLQRIPFSDPPRVNIISDNPALDNFEADLERVHIIGRICGVIARR
ncbi:S24 family peptidase [Hoeflea alexandrii]|uniref:XRE family transcriptional regulator n=1 Tax=Hoeflea alexandrii TaxID=288436 RepID=UPI0035CF968E